MPYAWIVSRDVKVQDEEFGGTYDAPRCFAVIDPSTGKFYNGVNATNYKDWNLCHLGGGDFSPFFKPQSQDVVLWEVTFPTTSKDQTPRSAGATDSVCAQQAQFMAAKGVDVTGLTADAPIRLWLQRILDAIYGYPVNVDAFGIA